MIKIGFIVKFPKMARIAAATVKSCLIKILCPMAIWRPKLAVVAAKFITTAFPTLARATKNVRLAERKEPNPAPRRTECAIVPAKNVPAVARGIVVVRPARFVSMTAVPRPIAPPDARAATKTIAAPLIPIVGPWGTTARPHVGRKTRSNAHTILIMSFVTKEKRK